MKPRSEVRMKSSSSFTSRDGGISEIPPSHEVNELLDFIRTSERGFIK